jgi:hypothetical protein
VLPSKFDVQKSRMGLLIDEVGQMPYHSKVSGILEHRPIAGTLVGAKGMLIKPFLSSLILKMDTGSDLMLTNLAQEAFEAAGWPTKIMTGRYMFDLADNVRNTAPAKDSHLPGCHQIWTQSMEGLREAKMVST